MTKKKLEEVFDIAPEILAHNTTEPSKVETHESNEKCGCDKPPNKLDPVLKTEIDKYFDSIKNDMNAARNNEPQANNKPAPRKHSFTPEGKAKMLENIKKAREVRRQKIEKDKPPKIENNTVENKQEPKQEAPPEKAEPKEAKVPQSITVEAASIPKPISQPAPASLYIVKSSFKKAPWVK